MAITDLTNTTWYVASGWTATSGYGQFNISGVIDGTMEFSIFYIGYGFGLFDVEPMADTIYSSYGGNIQPSVSFTLAITGGDDVTNADLISWLETYGELQVDDNLTEFIICNPDGTEVYNGTFSYVPVTLSFQAGFIDVLATESGSLVQKQRITLNAENVKRYRVEFITTDYYEIGQTREFSNTEVGSCYIFAEAEEENFQIPVDAPEGVRLLVNGKKCEKDIDVIPVLQEKTVTPMKEAQEVVADSGNAGLGKVIVEAIPDEYITPEWDGTFSVTGEPTTGGGSGGSDDRDFYYVGGQITASGSSKIGVINYFIAPKGETSNLVKHFSNVVQDDTYNFYVKIPKDYVIQFNMLITSTSFMGFQYFKSEKLGFNLENLTYGSHYTDWIEVTDDIDDIEAYAYAEMSGSGGAN